MDSALYWIWLADAVGSAFEGAQELLALCQTPRELYDHLRAGYAPPDALGRNALKKLRETEPAACAERLETCAKAKIAILTPEDPDYPERLRTLPDLPLVLYATGSTACLNGLRYVGMVGTRRPTAYGARACHDISLELARQELVIVSGLADGLDGLGHRAAVEAGRPTIAFLGTAIDVTYPAANGLLRRQIENEVGGAVLSDYPPGYAGKTKGTFLARNRLIAGMSEALCVAEARTRSGTMNTVGHAERYHHPVLAVPGSIFSPVSEGTNELLRTGRAGVLCGAADVLAALDIHEGDAGDPPAEDLIPLEELSAEARLVLAALGTTPAAPGALCEKTGLPAHRVLAALTELELADAVQPCPGQRYLAIR